jgi:hypothetical protein
MTRVAVMRGAGEDLTNNMCSGVVRGVPDVTNINSPAEVRPIGMRSLGESVSLGRAALRSFDALGGPWVGVGFSLGAYTLTEFARLDKPQSCQGLVLLGNPLRPRGQVTHGGVPANRFGLAGEVPVVGIPTFNFAVPDDPITSCPVDNGLRSISDLVTGRPQPRPLLAWNLLYTIDWAKKYLVGGRHVAYASERVPGANHTYVQAAAEKVWSLL